MSVLSSLFVRRFARSSLLPSTARQEARAGSRDQDNGAAQQEKFYQVVRDSMVRAGVLSSGYKFKALPRDRMGTSFLVMIDLAPNYPHDSAQLRAIEAQMGHHARLVLGVEKVAVYWRLDESLEIPVQLASGGMRLESGQGFAPIQPGEIAAYRNGGAGILPAPRHGAQGISLDLGATQFGDLD